MSQSRELGELVGWQVSGHTQDHDWGVSLMRLPRSVKGQSLDFEVGIGMTTAIMDYIGCVWANTGISTGEEVSNEDAPVGRVILDWTWTRGWACTTIVRSALCAWANTNGRMGAPVGQVIGSGLEKWKGKRIELWRSLWITSGVHVRYKSPRYVSARISIVNQERVLAYDMRYGYLYCTRICLGRRIVRCKQGISCVHVLGYANCGSMAVGRWSTAAPSFKCAAFGILCLGFMFP
jgi:hypothetical protein